MKCPDIYAIYLPQFHETEHNNKWWGKGYTEWRAVQDAKPLFEGHNQPRVPLHRHYYNLLEKEEMKWQAGLAKEYGIDGFIFYHYYFSDGEMELEKPAENLLRWNDIDMPFCFSWANESWIRTWSKWTGNSWTPQYDGGKASDTDDGILIKQKYGNREEWKRHFEYLLPFFRDSRYIKIDGRPLFFFYSPDDISCLKDMISYWRELAMDSGLKGLYLIGQRTWYNHRGLDALMIDYTLSEYKKKKYDALKFIKNISCIDYDDYWETTLSLKPVEGNKTYFEGRCGYDNTPRFGDYGDVLTGQNVNSFKLYLKELLKKSIYYKNAFTVIDAWNEWGEGMYLEPDEENGFSYLEAIQQSKKNIENISEKSIIEFKFLSTENDNTVQDRNTQKYHSFYKICSLWVDLLQSNITIFKDYLETNHIYNLAIYGVADLGKKLLRQLELEGITVSYVIDQSGSVVRETLSTYRPDDDLPSVDLIIVTAYDTGEIKDKMSKKISGRVIHLVEILQEIEDNISY